MPIKVKDLINKGTTVEMCIAFLRKNKGKGYSTPELSKELKIGEGSLNIQLSKEEKINRRFYKKFYKGKNHWWFK